MSDLGRPEYTGEPGLDYAADEVLVIIQITVENKRIACRERAHVSDLGESLRVSESLHDSLRVERAEQRVILLAVESGRESRCQRKTPSAGVVARVALVELEAVDTVIDEFPAVIFGEYLLRLVSREIRNDAAPYLVFTAVLRESAVHGRRRVAERVLPEAHVEPVSAKLAEHLLRFREALAPYP